MYWWCSVAKSCLTLCDLMDCNPARLLCPWQKYWSGLPFLPPGDLKPASPALVSRLLTTEPPGKDRHLKPSMNQRMFFMLKDTTI